MKCSICGKHDVPEGCQCFAPYAPLSLAYGPGARSYVFDFIVRQAIQGAPWREISAAHMNVYGITEQEIEEEILRRQEH